MPRTEDRVTIYDFTGNIVAKLMTQMTGPTTAEVKEGSLENLQAGVLYRASVDGRYYACTVGSDGRTLELNNLAYQPPAERTAS
jgi:hypothetical protein